MLARQGMLRLPERASLRTAQHRGASARVPVSRKVALQKPSFSVGFTRLNAVLRNNSVGTSVSNGSEIPDAGQLSSAVRMLEKSFQQTAQCADPSEALLDNPMGWPNTWIPGTDAPVAQEISVFFRLPYRCAFGQHLAIVGLGPELGDWDPAQRVPMVWTHGDIWTAIVAFDCSTAPSLLDYKFIVCNSDGSVSRWQPGQNCTLALALPYGTPRRSPSNPSAAPSSSSAPSAQEGLRLPVLLMDVSDTWQESARFRRVRLLTPGVASGAAALTADGVTGNNVVPAPPRRKDAPQPKPVSHSSMSVASSNGNFVIEVRQEAPEMQAAAGSNSTALSRAEDQQVAICFFLPYRCDYGQQLALVGSSEQLGAWDASKAVPMAWSEGDVWIAELKADAKAAEQLQYKFVVREEGGAVERWQEGSNCVLSVPPSAAVVDVLESWSDSQLQQLVRVVAEHAPAMAMTQAASGSWLAEQQQAALQSQAEFFMGLASGASGEAPVCEAAPYPVPSPVTGAEQQEAPVNVPTAEELKTLIMQSKLALEALAKAVRQHETLMKMQKDPTDPEVIKADRRLAVAHNNTRRFNKIMAPLLATATTRQALLLVE